MTETAPASPGRRLATCMAVAVVTALCIFLADLRQLADPFVRHDDFSALFGLPETYLHKASTEIRWVTFLWHLRDWLWPASVNYALFVALWSVWCAAFAFRLLGPGQFPLLIAATVVVATNSLSVQHMLWFNSLIPGMAILAIHAVLSLSASPAWHLRLLGPTVFLSFLSYTTYPMLALLVCLADPRMRTQKNAFSAIAVFCLSVAAALAAGLMVNLSALGTVMPELESWRLNGSTESAPVQRWWDPMRALALTLWEFRIWTFCLLLLLLWLAFRGATGRARQGGWILGVLALGAVPLYVFAAMTGFRMTSFAFVFAAVAVLAMLALELRETQAGRAILTGLAFVGLLDTTFYLGSFHAWQNLSRTLAAELDGPQAELVVYVPHSMPSSQRTLLTYRLTQLTGKPAMMCSPDTVCGAADQDRLEWKETGVSSASVARTDTAILVRIPDGS